ncbi:Oxygen-independent coproporphyrinogen-III oxidase 1 [Sporotomaculum syntrophicum]|uniref:Heme chaperone HemW n=1 Tax=Sporotomaculum syntrophicum TaxID=182264 RepID=A0A9D2WNM9_9FIRM|nr:radical SAM family heme chaperone HemW [Sporotomaculum syntrophicum]KAF1084096.1 Oxygen-independent coproporphyrinogen-III oxidase 1 [Sporotomaculum syntrophicum]
MLENVGHSALYIHVPFCVRKCRYCDFVSYPYNESNARLYVTGLRREMELRLGDKHEKRWPLSTVFIGGGTPTCLSTKLLLEIITLIKGYYNLSSDVEFTIEANPGTVDAGKLSSLRLAGVNRLSLGAQACSEATLRTLGRIHTHEQTVSAVWQAREAGFDNINLDLIFEVPGQTLTEWERCLEQVIDLAPEHVSAYGLQLEEGTLLKEQVDSGLLQPCEEEDGINMYQAAINILQSAGLEQYEISNFARLNKQCRHNLVYWQNEDYLGLGPAAHSRLRRVRMSNETNLTDYTTRLNAGMLPVAWSEDITQENDIFETIFLGLRMTGGLDLERFKQRFGRSLNEIYPGLVESLVNKGQLKLRGNHLCLTPAGMLLANAVMCEFAPV